MSDIPEDAACDSVAIGTGAHTKEYGEIQLVVHGQPVLQFFPDGRILIFGRPAGSDSEVVRGLRQFLVGVGALPKPADESVVLFTVETQHLERLRSVADRLRTDQSMTSDEMRDAAHDIMVAVRFAESLEALRGPGELYVHMTPKEDP